MSLFFLLSFYSYLVCLFCQHVSRQPPIKVFIVACHSKLYLLQATCDCHNNNATQCQTQMTSMRRVCLPACLSCLSLCLSRERQQVKVNCRVHSKCKTFPDTEIHKQTGTDSQTACLGQSRIRLGGVT